MEHCIRQYFSGMHYDSPENDALGDRNFKLRILGFAYMVKKKFYDHIDAVKKQILDQY